MSGFKITLSTPIAHQGPLPEAVDTVVIGGGIIGLMTALHLTQGGQKVLLCEKGRMAGEQSGRNWGWIRQQGRDYAELPIMIDALRQWHALPDKLKEAIGFRQCGITYLAKTAKDAEGHAEWLKGAKAYGLDTRMLSRSELEAMLPNAAGWTSAMFTPSDAKAEPELAVPALATYAASLGVTIRENCAVRALDIQGGSLKGVITEAGRVRAEQVVIAAGAWSSLFLGNYGVRIPQLSVLSPVSVTTPMPKLAETSAADSEFAIRHRMDGGYTLTPWNWHQFFIGPDAFRNMIAFRHQAISEFFTTKFHAFAPKGFPDAWGTPRRWNVDQITPFETMRILDPRPAPQIFERLCQQFATAFPQLGAPKLMRTWAGMIDSTPDMLPIIDRTPISGVILATGMSGHGFGIGPGAGRAIADLVMDKSATETLSAFRFDRF